MWACGLARKGHGNAVYVNASVDTIGIQRLRCFVPGVNVP